MVQPTEKKLWNEKFMTMDSDSMAKLQLEKLRKQLRYVFDSSPYYRERIQTAGIVPEKMESLEELHKIPLFTKEDHRKSQEESLKQFNHPYGVHMCVPVDEVVGVSATSGTTGTPTFYTFSRKDILTNCECTARSLWLAGVRPGDTVVLAFALSMFVGGLPLAQAIQYLGAKVVPVGAEAGTNRLLQFINLTRPDHIILTPSFAEYLVTKCPEVLGMEVKELGIKTLICGGEPGASDVAVRAKLESTYGAKVYDCMGGAYGFMSGSCHNHEGLHIVSSDYIHVELVDAETKKPVPMVDGAVGTMVHTSLEWEGAPNLRYDMGDLAQVFVSPCSCGVTGLRFKMLGRADDMLIIKGINVYPAAVKNLVTGFFPRTTGEMRIVLNQPGPKIPAPLKVRVEYGKNGGDLRDLKNDIERKIGDLLRFNADVELIPEGTLERTSTKTKLIENNF